MTFNSCCFTGRADDHMIVAHRRRPLMNQHASKTSVPPSVGADVSGIGRCSTAIFPKFSVKAIRLAEGPQFRNSTPKTASCTCRPARWSVTTRWTSSPATSERRIPISFIRRMARPRFCTIRDAWRGARGRKAKRRRTPAWISSSRGRARSRLFTFPQLPPRNLRNGIEPVD